MRRCAICDAKRIQGDELWCFVGKKQRNVGVDDSPELGDAWVFVALDADSKLIPAYTVGKRNRETTYAFLNTLRNRLAEEHRFQLTTDDSRSIARRGRRIRGAS